MGIVSEQIRGLYRADEEARSAANAGRQRQEAAARRRFERELAISRSALVRSRASEFLLEINREFLGGTGVLFRNGGEFTYRGERGQAVKIAGALVELMWQGAHLHYKITALAEGTTLRICGTRSLQPTNPEQVDDLYGPDCCCALISLVAQRSTDLDEIQIQLARTYYALVQK